MNRARPDASTTHGNFILADPDGSFIVGTALGTQAGNAGWDDSRLTRCSFPAFDGSDQA
jgi:hypothetical protein